MIKPQYRTRFSTNASACWLLGLTIGVAACGACGKSDREHFRVERDETPVMITSQDLGVAPAVLSNIGVRNLAKTPQANRFPAAICVSRVVARRDNTGKRRYLRLAEFSAHHAVYWNQLLDNQPGVREVLFLTEGGLDPRGYDVDTILNAAYQRNADLCVIYARKDSNEADAEYLGVLWDLRQREALLAIRVAVNLPPELAVRLAKQAEREDHDLSVEEADFRAEQQFRHLFRDAIWDLVAMDEDAPGNQSNPWEGYVQPRQRTLDNLRDLRDLLRNSDAYPLTSE